jgi:transcriptional regulator
MEFADKTPYRNRIELFQGTLDMLILHVLHRGAQHGYGISQVLRVLSAEVLQVETGSLYPALHRMERQGWVVSEWGLTDQNQRAKFYSLTPSGQSQLDRDRFKWETMVTAISSVFEPIHGQPVPET